MMHCERFSVIWLFGVTDTMITNKGEVKCQDRIYSSNICDRKKEKWMEVKKTIDENGLQSDRTINSNWCRMSFIDTSMTFFILDRTCSAHGSCCRCLNAHTRTHIYAHTKWPTIYNKHKLQHKCRYNGGSRNTGGRVNKKSTRAASGDCAQWHRT